MEEYGEKEKEEEDAVIKNPSLAVAVLVASLEKKIIELSQYQLASRKVIHDANNMFLVLNMGIDGIEDSFHMNQEQQELLTDMKTAILKAEKTLKRLLPTSELEAFQILDLADIIRQSVLGLSAYFNGSIEVGFLETEGLDYLTCLRHTDIMNLFFNLARNSECAFADAKVKKAMINISFSKSIHKDYHCLIFSDNAGGVDPKNESRIFDAYFTTKNKEGSGLGLASVKDTMARHKGFAKCENYPGQGLSILLFFPVVQRHD